MTTYSKRALKCLKSLDRALKKSSGSGKGIPSIVFEDVRTRKMEVEDFDAFLDWILDYAEFRGLWKGSDDAPAV